MCVRARMRACAQFLDCTSDLVYAGWISGHSTVMDCHSHKCLCWPRIHPFKGSFFPGLPRWAGTRKVKPIRILLKQETVSGSGISWAVCKSAPHCRQITTPTLHHSVRFTAQMPFLPPNQQRQSTEILKHWRPEHWADCRNWYPPKLWCSDVGKVSVDLVESNHHLLLGL